MFTGIVQDIGTVSAIDKQGDWALTIQAQLLLADVQLGASIACNGICVTVIDRDSDRFRAQFSQETLSKTTAKHWRVGTKLNLERALRMGDELGGHLLSGHVDGAARVVDKHGEGDSLRLSFELPPDFARFLAPKGSIAIDGVSLTVNEVEGRRFGVNIIPYTQQMTTLGTLNPGGEVNFEIDMIARYVDRVLGQRMILT